MPFPTDNARFAEILETTLHDLVRTGERLSNDNEGLYFAAERVEELLAAAKEAGGAEKTARFFADEVVPAMQKLRAFADDMEQNTAKKYWPFPTYGDILFSV